MNQKTVHLFLLLAVCYFSFFIHNGAIYADIMESRNLVTAREIVEDGNWLIPTMNGELRLEKPPLPTWVAAVIERGSPDNLPLQRAAAGVIATLLVFFLYVFAVRQTRSPVFGLMSALVLCTSFNIILMGRTATWDIYCHSFMLGAIYCLFRAGQRTGKCWKEFMGAGIFMGLSFLGKGPVSFYALLLPFLVAWLWIYRPSFRGKWGPLCVMAGLCLLISFWWPALLYLTHKEVLLSVWNKETTAWLERSVRPWYYYWKFFTETGVWALVLPTALVWPYWKRKMVFPKEYLFAVCWVFMVLIFLSLLPEKKNRYLLPILIPSALVTAHFFMYYWEKVKVSALRGTDRVLWRVNTLLIGGIVCLLPVGIYFFFYTTGKITSGTFAGFSFLFEVIAVWLCYTALKAKVLPFLIGVLGLFVAVESVVLPVVVSLFNNPDLKSIHAVREMKELEGIPFYHDCKEELRIELVYEAGRKILPYCFQDEEELPALPFVLVSENAPEQVLSSRQRERLEIKVLGIYDDNKRPANTSWHSPRFVHYVTWVSEKQE